MVGGQTCVSVGFRMCKGMTAGLVWWAHFGNLFAWVLNRCFKKKKKIPLQQDKKEKTHTHTQITFYQ